MRLRRMDRSVTVNVPGGPLGIEWRDDNHVLMSGPWELEHRGAFTPAAAPRAAIA